MMTEDDDDDSVIVQAATMGRTTRDIAKSFGMSVPEVVRVLDVAASDLLSGARTRREVAAEARRLHHLKLALWQRAVQDGDLSAAQIYLRCSERLSSLLGWNHPQGHVISVIGSVPEVQDGVTITQRTLDAIRLLRAGGLDTKSEDDDGEDRPS